MNDYAGQEFQFTFGQLGLLTDISPSDIPPQALILAQNITLTNGSAQKAPGGLLYNSEPLDSSIVALYDWWPTPVKQRMIVATQAGHLYRDDGFGSFNFNGGDPIESTTLIPCSPNSKFVSGGGETAGREKKLFFFSFGANQIQVLSGDGTIFEPIAQPPTDWSQGNYPKIGLLHRNRLWAFAGQQAYASDTADHENFVSGNLVIPVFPGEGGDIIGAFVYKGRFFCFKSSDFVYWLDDSALDSDEWIWKKISSNFGLSAPNAVLEVLDDMIAGNSTGTVTSYAATNALGDISAGDIFMIAQMENFLRGNSSKAGVEVQHALYYPEKKLIYFTYRSGYKTSNDMLVVVDMSKRTGPAITFWPKGSPQCLGLRKDSTNISRPMYGNAAGNIILMDYENRTEGGAPYKGQFQTPHSDCGVPDANKQFDWLSVKYVPEGNWYLNCDYFIDGKYMDTIQFPMFQYKSPKLNDLELDTNRLAQPNTETFTMKLRGSGRTISLRFWNEGNNQSFQVASAIVGFQTLGGQAQKAVDGD